MSAKGKKKLTIMVSSTVYGIEELLERIRVLLTQFGYEVWMSHAGTVQTFSSRSAFDNCLEAVEQCDLFLGIITPQYGSGQDKDDPASLSITHREMQKAIDLDKPRWVLAHGDVIFAWTLLKQLGYEEKTERHKLKLRKSKVFDDLRILDLYEETIVDHLPLAERKGNWVQKFRSDEEGARFVSAQFYRYQEVEAFIKDNFASGHPLRDEGGAP